jgi:hypothetical protein
MLDKILHTQCEENPPNHLGISKVRTHAYRHTHTHTHRHKYIHTDRDTAFQKQISLFMGNENMQIYQNS